MCADHTGSAVGSVVPPPPPALICYHCTAPSACHVPEMKARNLHGWSIVDCGMCLRGRASWTCRGASRLQLTLRGASAQVSSSYVNVHAHVTTSCGFSIIGCNDLLRLAAHKTQRHGSISPAVAGEQKHARHKAAETTYRLHQLEQNPFTAVGRGV